LQVHGALTLRVAIDGANAPDPPGTEAHRSGEEMPFMAPLSGLQRHSFTVSRWIQMDHLVFRFCRAAFGRALAAKKLVSA
jgi:hypothetical protein